MFGRLISMWFYLIVISVTINQTSAAQSSSRELNIGFNLNNSRYADYKLFETDNKHDYIRWLILDLIAKMHPSHCYALVFDAVYEAVFSSELFQTVNQAARFVAKIAQDEDTLNPRSALNCVLEEVRRAGCGGYIILLANGIQMERLLRFGDKTRIIDTRAQFVILHDYRLFVPELHYLWKRIVNVIFARRLRQKVSIVNYTDQSTDMLSSPVYELSTVPFPIPIKGIFFAKVINFWQSGKFRILNSILFGDKTADLRGQMMQVVVMEHTPAVLKSIPVNEIDNNRLNYRPIFQTFTKLYYGVEVELLKAISKSMHFQMNFYETADASLERWGTVSLNGTITGLLREMHEGRADFALADLHHTNHHLGFMDLTIPYNTECLTFLTPEALSDNSWKTLIMPFNGEMWAGVLLSLFSVGFIFYAFSSTMSYVHRHEKSYQPEYDMIKRSHRRRRKPKEIFGILTRKAGLAPCKTFFNRKLFNSSLRYTQTNRKKNTQSTVAPNFYNSEMKLQKIRMIQFKRKPEPWHDPLPPKDIFDSFAGCIIYTYSMLLLVSLPRLPTGWSLRVLTGWYWVYCVLVVVAYRASFTAILANPIPRLTIDTLQDLAKSPIRCGAWGEQNLLFFQMADDPHSQIIGTKLEHAPNPQKAVDQVVQGMYAFYENIYLLRQLRSTQKSEKARQTLHIMKECVVNMPISIGLEKNSPIKSQVDRYVRALVEGGLTGKWLSNAIEQFQSNVELPPQEATIDLTKMYAGIIALGLGYVVSMIAFMAEKCYWAYFVESNPSFDKYLLGTKFRKQR